MLMAARRLMASGHVTGILSTGAVSVPCRSFHASRVALAGYLGKKRKHGSNSKCLQRYEASYWENERAKEFVHQPKPKTEALLRSLFDRDASAKHIMRKAGLRWFEDDEGVKHLNERLVFFRDYLELDREATRRVLQGDYKLISKDFLDVETDLKPYVRFLRKELEFTNKVFGINVSCIVILFINI